MSEQIIVCPQCNCKIPLDEALSHQIRDRLDGQLRQEYESRLALEKKKITEQIARQEAEKLGLKMAELQEELEEKRLKLEEARKLELDLRKQQRELKDKEEAMELELQRKLDEARQRITEEVQQKNAERFELQIAEKEKTINDMRAQIEALKKKAEQGSQQQQGEVLELRLEDMLRGMFPCDVIEPVQKGRKGGDVRQGIRDVAGQDCGAILWEAKHAKAWSDRWVDKLKQDMAEARADVGIIVSTVLPAGMERFGPHQGIWVTDIRSASGLSMALRSGLVDVARARQSMVGKNEKVEYLYHYLTGTQFRQRVEAAVEAFLAMRADIESEKATMARHWAKREKMLERAIGGMAGMYGDLQGIIGMPMPELEGIEALALQPASGQESDH